ncbi:MAG: DUF1194 domain-containing protein [Rhodospirillaceae bacterium]|jgi:hypothetical protein|nr:DUF1194 domain-containing protein [Rhodospirillaceae bacterium]
MVAFMATLLGVFVSDAAMKPAMAQEQVDLELVLAADGSGSIDDEELRLQREGYARAVRNPRVLELLTGGIHGRSVIAFVEWGSAESQHTIVDWMVIDGPESAAAFEAALVDAPRQAWGFNSISNAIAYSQNLIQTNPYKGLRRIIDISADAGNIGGMPLPLARGNAIAAGITINGLAISRPGSTRPARAVSLEAEFREQIIGGAGAFVVTVDETISFAEAVLKKMILEVAGIAPPEIAGLPAGGRLSFAGN